MTNMPMSYKAANVIYKQAYKGSSLLSYPEEGSKGGGCMEEGLWGCQMVVS